MISQDHIDNTLEKIRQEISHMQDLANALRLVNFFHQIGKVIEHYGASKINIFLPQNYISPLQLKIDILKKSIFKEEKVKESTGLFRAFEIVFGSMRGQQIEDFETLINLVTKTSNTITIFPNTTLDEYLTQHCEPKYKKIYTHYVLEHDLPENKSETKKLKI